jgi:hypothetical protein
MTILGTETVTVQHYLATTIDGRRGISADGSPFTLIGSIQPVTGKMIEMLPEGARESAEYVMYVEGDPDLRIMSIDDQYAADRVMRTDGNTYEVVEIMRWEIHGAGLPHKAVALKRIGDDE